MVRPSSHSNAQRFGISQFVNPARMVPALLERRVGQKIGLPPAAQAALSGPAWASLSPWRSPLGQWSLLPERAACLSAARPLCALGGAWQPIRAPACFRPRGGPGASRWGLPSGRYGPFPPARSRRRARWSGSRRAGRRSRAGRTGKAPGTGLCRQCLSAPGAMAWLVFKSPLYGARGAAGNEKRPGGRSS